MTTSSKILVIDDDTEVRYSLERVLTARNYQVVCAASGEEGIETAKQVHPHVILLDNRMGGMSGIETLQRLRKNNSQAMVILMTAYGTTQTAIEAMKFGAFDYVIKPFDLRKVLSLIEKALQAYRDLHQSDTDYEQLIDSEEYKEGIVGSSDAMQEVFKVIGQVAASDVTVMITGESGTGKELVARAIYQHSHRSDKNFVAVNCAAIPGDLIESELFGHEKGSFTGATNQRIGKFEVCDGGTIFLDEIGDMALPTQTKILRAIQEGEIQRVGGTGTIKVDVRLIAATNKDLEKMVKEGHFREDLYYRLNVVRVRLPALRERTEDIPQLVDFMLQSLNKKGKASARGVSADALKQLCSHHWTGNVRELENVIYRAAVIAQGETILAKDLPPEIGGHITPAAQPKPKAEPEPNQEAPAAPLQETAAVQESDTAPDTEIIGIVGQPTALSNEEVLTMVYERMRDEFGKNILQELEREMIARALTELGGNQVKSSALLGITRSTLRKRIDQHQLRY